MSTRYGTDPDPKSPEEVEREVQQSRAEVEETLEAIQERLSPGQMFEQAVDYMRSSSGNDFLRNLGTTVRDNPVPVALVGTGLVWLMLASSRSTRRQYDDEDDLLEEYGESRYGAGDYPAGYHPASSEGAEYHDKTELGDTQGGSEHRSSGESVGERVQRAGEDAREAANEWSGARVTLRARGARVHARARVVYVSGPAGLVPGRATR